MIRRNLMVVICLFIVLLVSVTCLRHDPLRYGNSYNCGGYFTSNSNRLDEDFFSAHRAIPSNVIAQGHSHSNSVAFTDEASSLYAASSLYVWHQAAPEDLEQVGTRLLRRTSLSLGQNYNLAAVSRGPGYSSKTSLLEFGDGEPRNQKTGIQHIRGAVLHPSQLLLAGNYYPEENDHSSIIAVFDLTNDDPLPVATYTLNYNPDRVFGWSSNGEIIAVSGDDPKGLIMHYIHTGSGAIEQSHFQDPGSCVADAVWAPNDQMIVFSGESTADWDLYLESVASKDDNDGSLLKLTNTPEVDERYAAWSPKGDSIVYVKTYTDIDNRVRQELFLIDISDLEAEPVQLTDTLDEYETGPMWITEDEIFYLSVSVPEQKFLLKSISVSDRETQTLYVIPEEWSE